VTGTVHFYTIFHLNLAYSSIEEEQRPEVIRKCYWPLLRLARRYSLPVGIEASGSTLETVAALDPAWIRELRELSSGGFCEFVGSGYAQIIGPLVPARVNAANLRIGNEVYEELLGFRPAIALVNEQAYSSGMVRHYLDAGYRAIVMEWHNPALFHPEWDKEWRFMPQIACGHGDERIPVIWNNAIAFQKFQRYAHGEIELHEYLDYLVGHLSGQTRVLSLYGNDAEIFDFRPGRYHTEAPLPEEVEWERISRLFEIIAADHRFTCIRPGQALDHLVPPGGGNTIRLESPEQPVPVKKQGKYNIIRWAATGRDDLGINTACMRIYTHLSRTDNRDDAAWKELCSLWGSDFRTHITERRWESFRHRLAAFEDRLEVARRAVDPWRFSGSRGGTSLPSGIGAFTVRREGRYLILESDRLRTRLNCSRGLAVDSLYFKDVSENPLCGTLYHGYYDDISYGADFYTGHVILERPDRPKITDLAPVDPSVSPADVGGSVCVSADIPTELGRLNKAVLLHDDPPALELSYTFDWTDVTGSTLRIGNITLNPECFEKQSLFFRTHNGGGMPETFPVTGHEIDHAKAVSSLVSSSYAMGITENIVELGDARKRIIIEIDRASCAVIGFVTYHEISDSYFCRFALSAAERDDTNTGSLAYRKPFAYHVRLRLSALPTG
jgi:hypothetical protein